METWQYGEHANHLVDWFEPQGEVHSVLMYLHSGSWKGGTREQFHDFARILNQAGIAVASMDYRLVPEVLFPAPCDDIELCTQFLQQKLPHYQSCQWVLSGSSAGAHLAACYLQLYRKHIFDAVILLTGFLSIY